MNTNTLYIQRTSAGLSTRARSAACTRVVAGSTARAAVRPATGSIGSVAGGMFVGHMSKSTGLGHAMKPWLGGLTETGRATNASGTKRITTGSLNEVVT